MSKGLTRLNSFVIDHFPRRVKVSRAGKLTIRNLCPEWNKVLDKVHSEYRKLGGKITLILGDQTFRAYLSMVRNEDVFLETLTENVRCGYTVCLERKKVHS